MDLKQYKDRKDKVAKKRVDSADKKEPEKTDGPYFFN